MRLRSVFAWILAAAPVLALSCGLNGPSEVPGDDDDDNQAARGGSGGSSGASGLGGKAGGGAMCAVGQTSCSGVCTNTLNDFRNCGACGTMCGAGQTCANSACTCTAGLTACGATCSNLASDPANCGACGTACAGGQVCSRNACATGCAAAETQCGFSCTNALTDATNCGFCGNVCAGGQSCVAGACGCPAGQTTCNGVCVDTTSNNSNCGACGTVCTAGQVCSSGTCGGGSGGNGAGGSSGGSAGAGGSAGTAGSVNPSGGSGGEVVIPPERNGCAITPGLVADFEEGGTMPVVIKHEDRTGEWEMFNDGAGTNQTSTVEASGGTEMCDKFALHVKGSGYGTWGAGFGFSLVGPKTAPTPYNATAKQFTGIRFKAKLGAMADAKSPVRFNISTPWTESSENPGGQCMPTTATTNKAATECYQHAGRFMAVGAGADQLTSTFKEFTYCFDRDLYPLSLPSNLTTEQRNNIASSMLKVQFQFNQGKDYSGSYPANAAYPDFAKSLPFDFWVDDIEFFSGECPNMVPMTNNGSPMKPFPQNQGIGTCAPATNAPKFAAAIAQSYATWTRNFVQNDHIVAPEQQGAITSEAMGYGMMIAAAMGDKAAFDKFHGYVKAQGGSGSGNLMTWKNGGSGSATDGDIDIAFALLMASAQWGGTYATDSANMASGILSKDIVGNVIRGGSQYRDSNFNPSYFAPAAFAKFTGFGTALSTGYTMVNANVTGNTSGVPTDWGNPSSGVASGPGSAQVTSEITDGDNGAMGYDAARVPWRLGLHACQGGDKAALMSIVNLFAGKYDMGASIDLMKAGWLKTNGMPHTAAKDLQGSYIGPMGVGAMAMGNVAMKDRAFRTMLDILESGDFNHTYFPSTVGLLTALAMSGNFPMP